MKIVLDTNIILDVLLKRLPFFHLSYEMMRLAVDDSHELLVSVSAVTDIYYILQRNLRNTEESKSHIERLLQLVTIADSLSTDVHTALSFKMEDFEDAMVTALALRQKADCIVSRNASDFINSPVPVFTPDVFFDRFGQNTVESG